MQEEFLLPKGSLGRFAIVKLWPDIKTAEDECISRLRIAAGCLGVECLEIHADGRLISDPDIKVSKQTVDFVIHLHYDTPKNYDAFSFVALWNPLKFYHEWGYRRCSRNLTTHDDFISCDSQAADDHVRRMVRYSKTHLPPCFHLHHSLADVINGPTLGDLKLFYAGINWDVLRGGTSRHQEVLKRLDKSGLLRIYGPTVFQGVKVWAGYKSYVREIPFDGVSMVEEISKAGVALVLSSQAHKDSELMSNRLFESLAAGALVICDENPFAKRYFGDSLLYIDGRSPVDQICEDILKHLEWARTNPGLAIAKIETAQKIFREKFALVPNLAQIYRGLPDRIRELRDRQNPESGERLRIRLNLLMPEFSDAVLHAHIESVRVQDYQDVSAALIIDGQLSEDLKAKVSAIVADSGLGIDIVEVDYFCESIHREISSRRRLGEILHELISPAAAHGEAFVAVAPNERLLSNHLAVLAGALQRDSKVNCAATAAVLVDGENPVHGVHDAIDFGGICRESPAGLGRFIFRLSVIPSDIDLALPYLNSRSLAVLIGDNPVARQLPASMTIDVSQLFPPNDTDEAAEIEVIRDYCPGAFMQTGGLIYPSENERMVVASAMTTLQFITRFFDRRWVREQVRVLRAQGFRQRLHVLKLRLGL